MFLGGDLGYQRKRFFDRGNCSAGALAVYLGQRKLIKGRGGKWFPTNYKGNTKGIHFAETQLSTWVFNPQGELSVSTSQRFAELQPFTWAFNPQGNPLQNMRPMYRPWGIDNERGNGTIPVSLVRCPPSMYLGRWFLIKYKDSYERIKVPWKDLSGYILHVPWRRPGWCKKNMFWKKRKKMKKRGDHILLLLRCTDPSKLIIEGNDYSRTTGIP